MKTVGSNPFPALERACRSLLGAYRSGKLETLALELEEAKQAEARVSCRVFRLALLDRSAGSSSSHACAGFGAKGRGGAQGRNATRAKDCFRTENLWLEFPKMAIKR